MVKNKVFIAVGFIVFFLYNSVYGLEQWSGITHKTETKTKYFMHTGFMFDAVLRTAIFSYNLETPVITETEYDIILLDKVIIPKKTKIIGYASVLKSGDRANVYFHTIVFPDGSEINFNALALHTDGSAGIPGKVKKYRERVPAKILLESVSNVAAPGIGGELIKGLSAEAVKEMEQYRPTYSISVKKDVPILIYSVERINY